MNKIEEQAYWNEREGAKNVIVGAIAWIFIIMTFGFAMFKYEFGGDILWYFTIIAFVLMNVRLLYLSIDFIDRYNYVAIGIIGITISSLFLLVVVALIIIIALAMVKGVQQQQ